MRNSIAMLALALSIVSIACVRGSSPVAHPSGWHLAYPPETADERFPKGVHLLRDAPVAEWTAVDGYPSEDACETARLRKINETIDETRTEHGDGAKFELPVRRAVSARCVAR